MLDRETAPKLAAILAAYRWLTVPAKATSGLVFDWPLGIEPKPGMRIVLPTSGGLQDFGVVLRKATRAESRTPVPRGSAYTVIRLATEAELREAQEDHARYGERFWMKARIVVGLERGHTEHLGSFPDYFRTTGAENTVQALVYADRWHKLRARAVKARRPDEELEAYGSLSSRWKAVYDYRISHERS